MKERTVEVRGITLIALVITIIVLLILAGISIAALTGENGILTKTSTAKEESKKAQYKEMLELIGNGLRPEKVLEQLSAEEFMNRYQTAIEKETQKGGSLEGSEVNRKSTEEIRVITKEGYVYKITENEVKYLGQQGKNPPPDLQEADIDFKLDPTGYTTQNITVEIIPKINIEGYTLKYSTDDGKNWINYTEAITMEENGIIYARLINALDEEGGAATKEIDKIDRENPNKATITFNKNTIAAGEELKATVIQSDKGTSGVNIGNCRYIFTTSDTEIGTNDASKYTGGKFSSETQEITLDSKQVGTYYLHVLTVDKAGNKIETVSTAVAIRDTIAPSEATITFDKSSATVGESVIATVTQSDDQSGVDIANCRYIFINSNTAIGTSDVSKYSGGGFAKATNDKITLNCTTSGSYYLHVLTVDRAGNKKETISSEVKVEALVNWLIKDGQIINSNCNHYQWKTPVYKSSLGLASVNCTVFTSKNARNLLVSFGRRSSYEGYF